MRTKSATLWERIVMDWQHDWFKSHIKSWGGLIVIWVIAITVWGNIQ